MPAGEMRVEEGWYACECLPVSVECFWSMCCVRLSSFLAGIM